MSWRDERTTVLRSRPVQTTTEARQNGFDSGRWCVEVDALAAEMRRLDPHGGCWEWVGKALPDKWRQLTTAMTEIDRAFEEKDAGRLRQALALSRKSYGECVAAWGGGGAPPVEIGQNPNKTQHNPA
jgi:hypothetical protein